jgi:uncharacterized coiled-coil DUF342 family protein
VFSLALVLRNLLEPETAPTTRGELMSLLHRRASEPIAPFRRRELRYLRPAFARWLSLDPAARPSAAGLAAELCLLTRPEERREARLRLLRRLAPILGIAALLVSGLLLQLRQQTSELSAERRRLSLQMKQSEVLRKQSSDRLQQLEHKSALLGSQSQQLRGAIAIARQIDAQLTATEERADAANRKLRKLGEERDALLSERDGLIGERADLRARRDQLLQERDALSHERDELRAERDQLVRERDELTRTRDALQQDRDAMLGQRNDLLRQRDRVQAELASAQRLVDAVRAERDELRAAYERLKNELHDVRREFRALRGERADAAAGAATQAPAAAPPASQPGAPPAPQPQ